MIPDTAERYAGHVIITHRTSPVSWGAASPLRAKYPVIVGSPNLHLSRFTYSSRSAASSFGRGRSAFAAPKAGSDPLLFYLGHLLPAHATRCAASAALLSPLTKPKPNASRRFTVQRPQPELGEFQLKLVLCACSVARRLKASDLARFNANRRTARRASSPLPQTSAHPASISLGAFQRAAPLRLWSN
jgi:hypothetical protein